MGSLLGGGGRLGVHGKTDEKLDLLDRQAHGGVCVNLQGT
jgi:hypothetical protein